jgi:hypothetical protein
VAAERLRVSALRIFFSLFCAPENSDKLVRTTPPLFNDTLKGTLPNLGNLRGWSLNLANLLQLHSPRFPGIVGRFMHGPCGRQSVGRGPQVLAYTNWYTDTLTVTDGKFRTFLRIISCDSGGFPHCYGVSMSMLPVILRTNVSHM